MYFTYNVYMVMPMCMCKTISIVVIITDDVRLRDIPLHDVPFVLLVYMRKVSNCEGQVPSNSLR